MSNKRPVISAGKKTKAYWCDPLIIWALKYRDKYALELILSRR